MEIKTKTVDLRVAEATPGHLIKRASEPLETAHFTTKVYLGVGDSPDNYVEISEEEAEAELRRRERESGKALMEQEREAQAGEEAEP